MRRTKKNAVLLFVLLLLIAVTAMMVASTYSKYTAEVTGSGTVTVAKWAFKTDNQISTIDVELSTTADASTLVADRIAPGTEGSFNLALVNTNSEVGADFTVSVGTLTGNVPQNLKFYKDSSYSTEITPGTTTITGQLAAGDSTGVTVPVYWKWAYETDAIATNDPIDTQAGEATSLTMTIPVTITGVQTQPGAAIETHVN